MSDTRRRERVALGAHLRFSAATGVTTWAAMWSWRGFTDLPTRFLWVLLLVATTIALTGALARWRRVPGVLVVAAQVLLGGAVVCLHVGDRPYPGSAFWDALGSSVDAANTYASPVPATATIDVQPLLVVGGLVSMLLVDLCAATLRRVPLAGLPLLTVYSVPVSLLGSGLSWWVFATSATGFLLMLYLQEEEHLSHWGRSLDGRGEPVRRLSDAVRGSALAVGAAATAAAVLAPLAIPTFSFSLFDVGAGSGGGGDIDISNPIADLRKDLVRGEDIDLVTVRTDDPTPDHLRISVLNRFTDNEWSAGDRSVPTANLAQGGLPDLEGVDASIATQSATYGYDVIVEDELASRWLPTQSPINRIVAAGDWRFDDRTMDFLASDDELTTAGLSYAMEAVELQYDQDRLLPLNSAPTAVDDELTDLPEDFPASVRAMAVEATSGGVSDFEEAVLLNQWFRDTGGFRYDTTPDPAEIGTDELVRFLDPNGPRTGYCEQFAAAMGVMARSLGIPARVAVGFLEPEPMGDDTFVYSAHDLHAWVELYFPGAGWVLFDPTPPTRVGAEVLPEYAESVVDVTEPSGGASATEPTTAPPRPSETVPVPEPRPTPEVAPEVDEVAAGSGFPWLVALGVLVVMALLVVLVRLPRSLRARQRARRLGGGSEAAWAELRATAVDLRRGWPENRSPRESAGVVVGWFGRVGDDDPRPAHGVAAAPEAAAALDRIVELLEHSRYSRRQAVAPGSLEDDVLVCCAALEAGTTARQRRRATWLPASVTERRTAVEDDAGSGHGTEPERVTGGSRVEHI